MSAPAPNDIPAFDYEAAKDFYFDKLQADRTGKGRMESALFHTAQFIFDKGCHRQAALLARIAELERTNANLRVQCRFLETERASMLQAITDPENQPSQYGTVTLDYHLSAIAGEHE